ncbi:MAG: DUF421 domain-containing protein [Candidatus Pacebacteria bacterium]|nr:DUF421 domain-containing protein [Candidatus Paceibacterota bacterium]
MSITKLMMENGLRMENLKPFAWGRIFLGETPPLYLLEIVFRTAILYIMAMLLLRLLGKRGMSQLTPFEQVIIIALGSAIGDPMFYPGVSLLYSFLVVLVVVVVHHLVAAGIERFDWFKVFVEGRPTQLIRDGQIIKKHLDQQRINERELMRALRQEGIENTGQVKRAYLETSGKISLFRFESGQTVAGRPTLPEKN